MNAQVKPIRTLGAMSGIVLSLGSVAPVLAQPGAYARPDRGDPSRFVNTGRFNGQTVGPLNGQSIGQFNGQSVGQFVGQAIGQFSGQIPDRFPPVQAAPWRRPGNAGALPTEPCVVGFARIDSIHARMDFGWGGPTVRLRTEVETDRAAAGRFEMVVHLTQWGRRIVEPNGQPFRLTFGLDRPTDVDSRELEFERQFSFALPWNVRAHPRSLSVEALLIDRATGRVVEHRCIPLDNSW